MIAAALAAAVAACASRAPAGTATPAPSATPSAEIQQKAGERYRHRIAERDELRITVVGQPEASGTQRVNDDGAVVIAWIGEVGAAGRTESQLAELIRAKLADGYLKEPVVTVAIAAYGESVYVMGQVTRPGAYPFQPNLTVLQALALAGGATDRGAMQRARVLRPNASGADIVEVEPWSVLRPDDVLVVPERMF